MIPLRLQYFKSCDALGFVTGGLASLFSGTVYQSLSYNRDILGLVEHWCSNHRSSVGQCWGSGPLEYDFNATMNVFEWNVIVGPNIASLYRLSVARHPGHYDFF